MAARVPAAQGAPDAVGAQLWVHKGSPAWDELGMDSAQHPGYPWFTNCPRHRESSALGHLGEAVGGGVPVLTQDIDVPPGDAVEAGADGALVAHVQLLDLQRPPQRRPRRRRQRPAPAHVPHGGNDWGQRRLSPTRGASPGDGGVSPPRSPRKRRCLSRASRTASASPMPEEQPVISTVLGAMAKLQPRSLAPRL